MANHGIVARAIKNNLMDAMIGRDGEQACMFSCCLGVIIHSDDDRFGESKRCRYKSICQGKAVAGDSYTINRERVHADVGKCECFCAEAIGCM